jgi:hypothetical protein
VVTVNGLPASSGDHICAFVRGRAERDQLLLPFLREGVLAGDKCICIAHATDHDRIVTSVTAGGADHGVLQMEGYESTYLRSGAFAGEDMLLFWKEWSHRTFDEEGWDFARGAMDMSWAETIGSSQSALDEFLDYEMQATRFARRYPQVALCVYDLEVFGGNVIFPVMKMHPKVLFSGILLDNPYYLDPDEVQVALPD